MAHEERSTQRIFFIIKLLKWRFINTHILISYCGGISWCMQSIASHYEMDNSHSERVLIELSIQACKRAQSALCETCTRI